MRFRASLLLGLAIVAACGHQLDTSIQPDPLDAGSTTTDSGSSGTPGTDANTSNEASVGADDDDDAGARDADADVQTDQPDADADATVQPPSCTSFTESFENLPSAWKFTDRAWLTNPQPPYFVVGSGIPSASAIFQTSTSSNPQKPQLVHTVQAGCGFHLTMNLRIYGANVNDINGPGEGSVTFMRLLVRGSSMDFIHTSSGVLQVAYLGNTKTIGSFLAGPTIVQLLVSLPANGGLTNITIGGAPPNERHDIGPGSPNVSFLTLGYLDVPVGTSAAVNLEVDDIVVGQ